MTARKICLPSLTDETEFRVSALQQLLLIHQATSEWQQAIDVAERLVKLGKDKQKMEIAHFYCELALQAMGSDDLERAMSLLKKGEAADRQSARVSIMMGRILMAQEEFAKATGFLQRVIEQDKELVSETLPMLETCYGHLQRADQWAEYLQRCVEENTGAAAELYLADIVEAQEGAETAEAYVNRQLQRHPTMRVFHRLMDFHLQEAEDGPREREPDGAARYGWRTDSHQAALSLSQMRFYRACALLALSFVPRMVLGKTDSRAGWAIMLPIFFNG